MRKRGEGTYLTRRLLGELWKAKGPIKTTGRNLFLAEDFKYCYGCGVLIDKNYKSRTKARGGVPQTLFCSGKCKRKHRREVLNGTKS